MIKQIIEEKFGSVNRFCESLNKEMISKQTVYKLLQKQKPNPTVSTVVALAYHLQMEFTEVALIFKRIQEEIVNENVNS